MDELFKTLAFDGSFNLWGEFGHSNDTSFKVTEGWINQETGKVEHKTQTVTEIDRAGWLAKTSRIDSSGVTHTLVLRLVLVDVDVGDNTKDKRVHLAEDVQRDLLQAFGLELAHRYAGSCLTEVSAIPPPQEQPDLRAYSFCFLPKLAAVWSHSQPPTEGPRRYITQGLIFVQKKDSGAAKDKNKGGGEEKTKGSGAEKPSEKALLMKLLSKSWDESLYRTAMLPPLLFGMLLLATMYRTDAGIKEKIKKIEGKTEHHDFQSVDEKYSHTDKKNTTAEFAQLSANASGCANRLASAERKGKMVETTLRFMANNIDRTDGEDAGQGRVILSQHVQHLQGRLDMLNGDMEYTLKRVKIQISALAGLISGNDSFANIELAKQSYRDSLSMKTLAIVTMFFLPGSFVSALFSTPMFDWDAAASKTGGLGLPTTPQFDLYWIITIPLTVATFSLYFLWFQLLKRQVREKPQKKPQEKPQETRPDKSDTFDKGSHIEKGAMSWMMSGTTIVAR